MISKIPQYSDYEYIRLECEGYEYAVLYTGETIGIIELDFKKSSIQLNELLVTDAEHVNNIITDIFKHCVRYKCNIIGIPLSDEKINNVVADKKQLIDRGYLRIYGNRVLLTKDYLAKEYSEQKSII